MINSAANSGEDLVGRAEAFAANGSCPAEELARLHELELMTAALPRSLGGAGLGSEPGGQHALLRVLAAIGGADLAMGRLFEGHVNALLLLYAFGTPEQKARAAEDARAGRVFGVWNTGGREPLRLERRGPGFVYRGGKTFASGAGFVDRPIVTAELEGVGWQMTLPRMEAPGVAECVRVDRASWQPLGMERSESFSIEFTGAAIGAEDLIGDGGDFYRDPLFRGGAVRFTAVQAGAVLRLQRMFAGWVAETGRGDDPYQLARLGEGAIEARECRLWIEHAAAMAEGGMGLLATAETAAEMVLCAHMMRLAVERIALRMMERVERGVGARGLLEPAGFAPRLRDLRMYLRQPAPDETLAAVGRAALEAGKLSRG